MWRGLVDVLRLERAPELDEVALGGIEPGDQRAHQRIELVDLAILIRDPDLELDDRIASVLARHGREHTE